MRGNKRESDVFHPHLALLPSREKSKSGLTGIDKSVKILYYSVKKN
jgi:hypothetical protein